VAAPVIHNTIRKIFGNSGKLSQLFCCRGVDVNGGGHIDGLDVHQLLEVLHTLREE
jgi:hypothetical protein